MKRIFKIAFLVIVAWGVVVSGVPESVFARGGSTGGARSSGGSRSSSGSSRSFSRPSTPSKPSAPSKPSSSPFGNQKATISNPQRSQGSSTAKPADSATATNKSTTGAASPSSTQSAPARPLSAADQATLMKAKTQGTVYTNKTDAVKAFTSNPEIKAKYPSTFQTEPAVRPDYIPQATSLNGSSYPVTYDAFHGGYGFMGPLGVWMAYDALSDSAAHDRLMKQNNYVVQTAEAMPGTAPVTSVARPVQTGHRGLGFFGTLLMFGGLGLMGWLIFTLVRKKNQF
jgi:hypothetical protein